MAQLLEVECENSWFLGGGLSASKKRPPWSALPASVCLEIERLVAGPVVGAENCPGGFSPGFASLLTLPDGRQVFVKAVDGDAWPGQAQMYRVEARVAASLPATVPAPRFLGSSDDGHWVILAFAGLSGAMPAQPWNLADLDRVLAAVTQLSQAVRRSPLALPRKHPRLGGWEDLARDQSRWTRLAAGSAWAAEHLSWLITLERHGLEAAQGTSLVHFDLYPHNIVLTSERVYIVDWPHARLGAPFLDLVLALSSAAADNIDPEPIFRQHPLSIGVDPHAVDAVLAAHAGFCIAGSLDAVSQELRPIVEEKARLGHGALAWLRRRLGRAQQKPCRPST